MTSRERMIAYVINTQRLAGIIVTREDAERIVDRVYAEPVIRLRSRT